MNILNVYTTEFLIISFKIFCSSSHWTEKRNVNLHIKTELTNQAIVIQEYKPKNRKRRKSSVELRPKKTAKIEYTKPRSVTKPGSTKINPMNPPSIKRYEFEDSEESTKLPEPQNVALQFDSLFAGPFCFKGQVKPNAKVLHKKLLTALKNNSNQTYTLDDSDWIQHSSSEIFFFRNGLRDRKIFLILRIIQLSIFM